MMSNNIIRLPLTGPSLHKAGSAAGPRYLPPPSSKRSTMSEPSGGPDNPTASWTSPSRGPKLKVDPKDPGVGGGGTIWQGPEELTRWYQPTNT